MVIGSLQREAWTFAEGVRRVLIPVYLIGTAVYFYGTQSAYSSRKYTPDDLLSGVFLPSRDDRWAPNGPLRPVQCLPFVGYGESARVLVVARCVDRRMGLDGKTAGIAMEPGNPAQSGSDPCDSIALLFRPESPVGNATGLGPFFHPAVTLLVMVLGLGIQIPTLGKRC